MIPWRAYVALALAQVLVGSLVVTAKLMTAALPVFLASALRSIVGLAILLPLLLWREGRLPRVRRRDGWYLFWIAFAGMFLFSVFLLYGLRWTTAVEGGIITSASPAVLGLIAWGWMGERLGPVQAAGIAFTVVGLVALNLPGLAAGERGSLPWLGNLLIVGVAITEALFSALGKQVSRALSPLAIATYVTAWGLAMFAPFALWEALHFDFSAAPWQAWVPVVYYGLFVGAGAFLLWYWGLARVPAGTAAVFLGLMPISAVALSVAVLGERLQWSHLAGAAGVLAGIACITLLPEPPRSPRGP